MKASENLSLEEERKLSTEFFLSGDKEYEPVYRVEDREIKGREGASIPLRIYTPEKWEDHPPIVYFHRGGWVFGSIQEGEYVCRKLANYLKCLVVSVEYRLAPENPFPLPLYDCYDAVRWVYEQYGERVVVSGESAGGNLAGAVALMAQDQKEPFIAAALLIYPVISSQIDEEGCRKSPDQYFLTKEMMKFFLESYLQLPEDYKNPYASLNLAPDFTGLPPTAIIAGEYDPLSDEAERYAKLLEGVGVRVEFKSFPEVIHGFIDLPIYDDKSKTAWIHEIGDLLKRVMKPG